MIGKSDKQGIYNGTFKPGKYEFRVVSKGYIEEVLPIDLLAGKKNAMDVVMKSELQEAKPIVANTYVPAKNDDNDDITDKVVPAQKEEPTPVPVVEQKPQKEKEDDDIATENQVVVCLNCGYVNTAPAGKKLRFCVNCAKSLK